MKLIQCMLLLLVAFAVVGNCDAWGQVPWTKDAHNPVLSGATGTWNKHVFNPCVLFNADSARFEMWFNATTGPSIYPGWRPYNVGFAVSKDGINWTMYTSAVLSPDPGTWDNVTTEQPEVIRENGEYKMWYTSWKDDTSPDYLGYATSPDGIHWTKYAGNPVFGSGTALWEAGGPFGCSVMPAQRGYKMWYAAYDASFAATKIGYAESPNGIDWTRDTVNNPIVDVGAPTQWDDSGVFNPNVLLIGNAYYMWYAGGRIDGVYKSGLAVSVDGAKWIRDTVHNPVLVPSPGAWDGNRATVGTVLLQGTTFHMWYDGWKEPFAMNIYSIGHATSPFGAVPVGQRGLPENYLLKQNYPNPFNPSTTIRYELPHASRVSLKVYNTLGQEVATLVNETKPAGMYTVQFDARLPGGQAGRLASGVYFYRLEAGTFVQTKRLVLLR
jgi:predicted GH43/DUF377 family glycosyl hydrolase